MHENAPDAYFYWVLTCALKMPGCTLGLLSFNIPSLKVCSSEHFIYTVRRCVPVSLHECVHTHSWPFHSCVRASSGCRSGAHPGRTVSPALWILLSALPSVCPTASHTCIAPLQRGKESEKKKKTFKHKHWGRWSTLLKWREQVPGFIRIRRKCGEASHN